MFKLIPCFLAIFALSLASNGIIHQSLKGKLTANTTTNIIISMSAGTDQVLTRINQGNFSARGSRLASITSELKSNARESQSSILAFLSTSNLNYKSFWISNVIYVEGATADLIDNISKMHGIFEIREETVVHLEKTSASPVPVTPSALEPNIIQIEAYRVWEELGIYGRGAVIASIDTGVRGTHISLRGNYLGDYGWFDPTHGTATPADFVGQGTHSMGVMVGKYGIGVAPGAKWMACRACDFSCPESALTACAQFILCPTLADGSEEDCTKAPHVVNNAWFTVGGNSFFNPSIEAWKAGGIIPVFTAGNGGPNCMSIRSPADSTVGVIGVSSTTQADTISERSSRGPSVYGQIKPDIVAPGESIISASNLDDTGYVLMMGAGSGTAHVAGTIGLIVSAGQESSYNEITKFLFSNTDTWTNSSGQNCGGVSEDEFPNNSIGWGRINAYKAVMGVSGG